MKRRGVSGEVEHELPLESSVPKEVRQRGSEEIWLFDVREVSAVLEPDELRAHDPIVHHAGELRRADEVVCADEDQCRRVIEDNRDRRS